LLDATSPLVGFMFAAIIALIAIPAYPSPSPGPTIRFVPQHDL
jgi:hypothetical protein